MTPRRLLLVLPLAALACGQYEGPRPGLTYFWQLKTSTVEFGACSDAADFRAQAQPVPLGESSFLVYRISPDGTQAVTQRCERLDPSTCSPADGGVVFEVAGRELTHVEVMKTPVGSTGCSLQETVTTTLVDAAPAVTLDFRAVLTLVDAPQACAKVDADLAARSPNGLGAEGCVITNRLTGELR